MIAAIIAALSTFFTLHMFNIPGVNSLKRWFSTSLVQSYCVYPKTSTLKEKDNPAIQKIDASANPLWTPDNPNFDYNVSALVDWTDINIGVSGIHSEMKPILDTISANPKQFFIDQIDCLFLSKMGMEVLCIQFGDRGRNRSLFLELINIRNQFLTSALLFEGAISIAVYVITNAWENGSLQAVFS